LYVPLLNVRLLNAPPLLVNTVGKRGGFFARVTSDNQGKSTSNSSRYKNRSADNAWFWVEAVTFL